MRKYGRAWTAGWKMMLVTALVMSLALPTAAATPSGIIYAANFGAVPDDMEDDTRAIRQAILAAEAIGGTVVFESGTYRIAPPQDTWTFADSPGNDDWAAANAASTYSGGLWNLDVTQGPLELLSPDALGLDMGKYGKLQLRLQNDTNATEATVYWTTDEEPTWNSLRSQTVTLTPNDTVVRDYTVQLDSIAQWNGVLKQVQIVIGDSGTAGEAAIERIQWEAASVRAELMYSFSFLFRHLQDVELAGDETRFLITDPIGGFIRCLHCSGISFDGFTVDYETPPFIQGYVSAIDSVQGTFDFVPDAGYNLFEDERIEHFPRIWGTVMNAAQPTLMKQTAADHINIAGWSLLPDGVTYRVTTTSRTHIGAPHIESGDPFVFVTREHGNGIFRFEHSDQIAISDFKVHASSGVTLVGYYADGIEIDRLRVERKPGSGRMIVTSADSVHVQSARVGPVITDSLFEGVMDDIVAIYNRPLLISQVISDTTIQVAGISGSLVPAVGDELQFFEPHAGVVKGTAIVTHVAPSVSAPDTQAVITLDTPVPGLTAGSTPSTSDLVFNLSTVGEGLHVQDSIFRDSRRNGLYLKTTGATIEGNHFENLGNAAIMLTDDPDVPNGPAPVDIHVEGNTMSGTNFLDYYNRHSYAAAITVFSQKKGRQVADGKNIANIVLHNNDIQDYARNAIYLGGVKQALLTDNVISNGLTFAPAGTIAGVSIESSEDVEIDGLEIYDLRSELAAGIVVQGISSDISYANYVMSLASGVPDVLNLISAELPDEAIIVNLSDPGYSEIGSWINSGLRNYDGGITRYSFAAGAQARWTPDLAAGDYEVLIYRVTYPNSAPNSKVTVYYDGGSQDQTLNYTLGSSNWVSLGVYPFVPGTGNYVALLQDNPSQAQGALRAAAVAFVPIPAE